ncbi:MAG: GTPase Era [Candidatus Omnitrophica bacterium]|nr:GTPase Era [Candidatus Omnitrophota bacterium]
MKSGFASIVGRPNVGKSTLLNYIVGEKVAIVSNVPQTTRTALRGIYTEERGQIVFVDTPGWHVGRDGLDRFMNQSCVNAIDGVDCIIHVVDSSEHVGEEERRIVERLKYVKTPIILAFNKIDLKGKFIPEYIALWEESRGKKIDEIENFLMIPLSGKVGTKVDALVDEVFKLLPDGPFHYEADTVCDIPKRQVVSDIVREKLFMFTREELPHSIAVVIEDMRPVKGKTTRITAIILVERDSQKEIVIGHQGAMLKKVGTMARAELEDLLGTKVYLELFVKAHKDWRDDQSLLTDLGYAF